jgi:hypothetical protein
LQAIESTQQIQVHFSTTGLIRKNSLQKASYQAIRVETGSYLTAHTTIQSSQTAHFVVDSKEAVFAGISPVSSPNFPSLWTSAVSRADFWPPVSASKNSVPDGWISRSMGPFSGLESRDSESKMRSFEPWP